MDALLQRTKRLMAVDKRRLTPIQNLCFPSAFIGVHRRPSCLNWFLALVLAFPALPQQIGQNTATPASSAATLPAHTQLVIETVKVKDKNGNPVEGLTANDFMATEDGAPQTIRFFEFQKLPAAPDPVRTLAPRAANVAPLPKLPHTQIEPEKPGDVRYRDRRLLAIYFDLSAMPIGDQLRAFDAARKSTQTQMPPAALL